MDVIRKVSKFILGVLFATIVMTVLPMDVNTMTANAASATAAFTDTKSGNQTRICPGAFYVYRVHMECTSYDDVWESHCSISCRELDPHNRGSDWSKRSDSKGVYYIQGECYGKHPSEGWTGSIFARERVNYTKCSFCGRIGGNTSGGNLSTTCTAASNTRGGAHAFWPASDGIATCIFCHGRWRAQIGPCGAVLNNSSTKVSWNTVADYTNESGVVTKKSLTGSNAAQIIVKYNTKAVLTVNPTTSFEEGNIVGYTVIVDNVEQPLKGETSTLSGLSQIPSYTINAATSYHSVQFKLYTQLGQFVLPVIEVIPGAIITYDGNNEAKNKYGDETTTKYTGNTEFTLIQYKSSANIRSSGFAKEGYHWTGVWNTKPDGSGEQFTPGQNVTYDYIYNKYGPTLTVYSQWEPNNYTVKFNGNGNENANDKGSSMSDVVWRFDKWYTIPVNTFKREYKVTYNPGFGTVNPTYAIAKYTFLGWSKDKNAKSPTYYNTQKVRSLVPENTTTLYAIWQQEGVILPLPSRTGWDWVAWYDKEKDGNLIGKDGDLWIPTANTTLYARWKRDCKLTLEESTVISADTRRPAYTFDRTIYSPTLQFDYKSSDVVAASTREYPSAHYTIKFVTNDINVYDPINKTTVANTAHYVDCGETRYSDGNLAATALDMSTHTITAYPTFRGWFTQAFKGGTNLGSSASTFVIKPYEYTSNKYQITGNRASADVYSNDRHLTIYPQWNEVTVHLPKMTRNEGNTGNGKEPDKFIGWFTEPQPTDGGSGSGGEFYGRGDENSVIGVDGDLTLYAWFNVAPTVIESQLGKSLHNGSVGDGYFEGQIVSYDELLSLITTSDVDNPVEVGPDRFIQWDGTKSWLDLYAINKELYLHDMNVTNGWGLSAAQEKGILDKVNTDNFVPTITGVTFYQDGKDSKGNSYPTGVANTTYNQSGADIKAKGLNTSYKNVGKMVIHYQITDNGTFVNGVKVMTGATNPKGGIFNIDSPITVNFDIVTQLNFNHLPTLSLDSTSIYSDDPDLTMSTIEQFLWEKQDALDREDDADNKPWWKKEATSKALDDSIKIISVYDIEMQSGYELEHPNICDTITKIRSIQELFSWKTGNEQQQDAFRHISSFRVEYDCVDQWGKTASGYLFPGFDYSSQPYYDGPTITDWEPGADRPEIPGGQTQYDMDKDSRSITVVVFNNEDDADLVDSAAVSEGMRYIDRYSTDTLNQSEYWGSAGQDVLNSTFDNYLNRKTADSDKYNGTIVSGSEQEVNITVNDYTQDTAD